MKYIFIILICFLSLTVHSQVIQNRANASVTVQDARWKSLLNLYIPLYADTTAANLQKGLDTTAALIYTYNNNSLWFRSVQKKWVLVGTGGSGSGQLFAVGDSTATGTRYFNQKKNAFIYDSAGSHIIVAYDTFNHYFTKFYLDTTYTYLQVSSNDFNTFGSISVTKNNATVSASSPDSGHQVVVNNGNVTVRDLRNHPSKLVITGISTGTDTVFAPTQILVLQGDTVKSARYPSLSPTDTANLSYRIDTVGKIIYIDTTQYLRFNLTDSILYSIPVNGVFANGLISIGGINLLDSTLTILPNIVFVRNDTTYTLTSSASFIIHSTVLNYYRTDLIYVDSNNVIQHLVGIEDTVITVPPPVPYKGIGIAVVNVHNGVINSTIIPTANNWLVGGQSIAGDSSIGTLTNNGMLFKIGGVSRSIYPATGGFALYGIGTSQMNAIVSPLAGTIVYNNDSTAYCYYNGSAWVKFGSGGGGGGSQTWQQTLITGSTFTQNNHVSGNQFEFGMDNLSDYYLYSQSPTNNLNYSGIANDYSNTTVDAGDSLDNYSTLHIIPNQASLNSRDVGAANKSILYVNQGYITYINSRTSFPYPSLGAGEYYLPLTVNGVHADTTGNITISSGGTITHAVDSIYTLTDSLLLVHTSPYNRTDTFAWRGSGGGTTYVAGTNVKITGNIISAQDSSAYNTISQPNDTTLVFGRPNGIGDTLTIPSSNNVDSIYRTPGKDSIQYTINGRYHAIKDSTGGSGGGIGDSTYFWKRLGNYGTTYADRLGTKDRQGMRFIVNDSIRMTIDSIAGNLGIGGGITTGWKMAITSGTGQNGLLIAQASSGVGVGIPSAAAIRWNPLSSGGAGYLDVGNDLSGTLNIRAATGVVLSTSPLSGQATWTNQGSINIIGGSSRTYNLAGNSVLGYIDDSLMLRFNNNTQFTKVGMKGSYYFMNDAATLATYDVNKYALLDLGSTTKGILYPRLTSTQRSAIVTSGVVSGTIVPGTGGTNGTYYNISLTGGSGTLATATIFVTGSGVNTVTITNTGSGYVIGDVLSATLPGLSGFTYTLTKITGENGLKVYNTDTKSTETYDGSTWRHSPTVYTGTAAPATTPVEVGDMFVDTTNKKIYVSTGTSSSSDWTILN